MASLPPMEWSEIATKSDLHELELRLSSHMDQAPRQQTQWVFGAVVAQCLAVLVAILTLG